MKTAEIVNAENLKQRNIMKALNAVDYGCTDLSDLELSKAKGGSWIAATLIALTNPPPAGLIIALIIGTIIIGGVLFYIGRKVLQQYRDRLNTELAIANRGMDDYYLESGECYLSNSTPTA
jgi:hypothetical protein